MSKKNIKYCKNKRALASINVLSVLAIIFLLLISLIGINAIFIKNLSKNENRVEDYITAHNAFVLVDELLIDAVSENISKLLKNKTEDADLSEEILFDDGQVALDIRDKIYSISDVQSRLGIRILNISIWSEEYKNTSSFYDRKTSSFTKVKDLKKTAIVVMYNIDTGSEIVRCRKVYFFKNDDIRNFDFDKDILFGEIVYERLKEK